MNLKLQDKSPWRLLCDMEDFWGFPEERKKQAFPACDFHEDKDHCFISLDLPGLKKEDIKIRYENKILSISGNRKEEYKRERGRGPFVEKFYGSFQRSFSLPFDLDEDKISAHFSNGVLELALPKTSQSKGKEIAITEGQREAKLFSKLSKDKKETA